MVETFCREQRMVLASFDILKFVVLFPETKEIVKASMTQVFIRNEVLEMVGQSLSAGGYEMVKGDQFRTRFN